MLEVKNLKKYFGGVKAVDNCSFKIDKNKITALIGPNGSGKSTVFNLISGVIKQDEGRIIFDSYDISTFGPEDVSNIGISRLFQQTQLFKNLTVKENLLLAIDNEDTKFWKNLFGFNRIGKEKEEQIKNILKMLEMSKFLDKKSSDLSYGQKRLVEIARSILNPHKLLMLDEPVAGINPKLRNTISKALDNLRKEDETVLLIEHDMNFALSLADEVIVLDKGKVIAQGKSKEIRNNKQVLKAYLGE